MAEIGPRQLADVLGPVARLALNAQLVVLALLVVAAEQVVVPLVLLAAMVLTAVVPVIRWERLGPRFVASVWPLLPSLLLATGSAVVPQVPGTLALGYGAAVALLAGLLHGAGGGIALALVPALGFLAPPGFPTLVAVAMGAALPLSALAGGRLRHLVVALDRSRREVADRTVRLVSAEDRAAVARSLHDTLAKTIEGVALVASQLDRDGDRRQQQLARQVHEGVQQARREARALLDGLREDEPSRSLRTGLVGLAATFGDVAEVDVVVDVPDDLPELASHRRHEVLQVVREALRNVEAHAGATTVRVSAAAVDGRLRVEVTDDGRGGARPRPGHHGLTGMRERAALLGGALEVGDGTRGGTAVQLEVPVDEARR